MQYLQIINFPKTECGLPDQIVIMNQPNLSNLLNPNPNPSLGKRSPSLTEICPNVLKSEKKVKCEDFGEDQKIFDTENVKILNRANEKINLKKILMLIYEQSNITVTDLSCMNNIEIEMLKSLLKRKFNIDIGGAKNFPEDIISRINHYKVNSKTKRFEENAKLVFKRGYKFLLKNFRLTLRPKVRKRELEGMFFDHCFNTGEVDPLGPVAVIVCYF